MSLNRRRRKKKRETIVKSKPPRAFGRPGAISLHHGKFKLPPGVVILGSGYQGVLAYDTLVEKDENGEQKDFIIGVNGAVNIPGHHKKDFKIHVWFLQDPRVTYEKWFKEADRNFAGIRVASIQCASRMASFQNPVEGMFYTFDIAQEPELNRPPWAPDRYRFRTDTTVSGSALWLCRLCRVRRVEFIGVDMVGGKYHNSQTHPRKRKLGVWPVRDKFEQQISWVNKHGLAVETRSYTSLRNVPPSAHTGWPEKIYIVGPGKNGLAHLNEIGEDEFVVALNLAGLTPSYAKVRWKPSALVIADKDAVDKDYFPELQKTFKGQRCYSVEVCRRAQCEADVTYPIDTIDGIMYRSAGTVAGVALWLHYINGGTEAVLCGIDMSGNEYANNTSNPDPRWLKDHGSIWRAREVFDARIRYVKLHGGMKVSTMSDTTLREVEKYVP